jgi:hypothetical protein
MLTQQSSRQFGMYPHPKQTTAAAYQDAAATQSRLSNPNLEHESKAQIIQDQI